MFSDELEMLIDAAIADGEISEKERAILHKRAQAEGVDIDEFDMILDSRLHKQNKKTAEEQNENSPSRDPDESIVKKLENKISSIERNCFRQVESLKDSELPYNKKNSAGDYSKFRREKQLAIDREEIERDNKIKGVIDNLHIPSVKEDVYELLIFLQPKTTEKYWCPYGSDVKKSYIAKFNECLNLARVKFSNVPEIKNFIQALDEEKEKENAKAQKAKEDLERQTLAKLQFEVNEAKKASYKGSYESREKKKSKAVAAVIEAFTLPTDRNDLLELLKFLRPFYNKKVWKDRNEDYKREAQAYMNKYIEGNDLAKRLFPEDSQIEAELIKEEKKKGIFGFFK